MYTIYSFIERFLADWGRRVDGAVFGEPRPVDEVLDGVALGSGDDCGQHLGHVFRQERGGVCCQVDEGRPGRVLHRPASHKRHIEAVNGDVAVGGAVVVKVTCLECSRRRNRGA